MKYLVYLWATMFTLWSTSCIDDESTGAVSSVSEFASVDTLQAVYSLDRWDTLVIDAPKVVQTNADKKLSYSWEIDYKEVSTDATLKYVCPEFGKFPARLKITNGDVIKYIEFTVDVRYSYVQGLYMLAENGGKTILSYLPVGVEGKSFALDVLSVNNPTVDFGTPAQTMHFTNLSGKEYLYIATKSPSTLFRIEPNLMQLVGGVDVPEGNITHCTDDGISTLFFMAGGSFLSLAQNTFVYTNGGIHAIRNVLGDVELADAYLPWLDNNVKNLNGYAAYDNKQGRFVAQPYASGNSDPREILNGSFTGMKLVGMTRAAAGLDVAMVLHNPTNNTFHHAWVYPGYYVASWSSRTPLPAEIRYMGEMPASSGITASSVVVTNPVTNLMYYSSGNAIYVYNIVSKGNYPTSAQFTVGTASETIVDMKLSKDYSKLYVATNASSGTLVGSVYCFDLTERKLLWSHQNVTGKIVEIAFREAA